MQQRANSSSGSTTHACGGGTRLKQAARGCCPRPTPATRYAHHVAAAAHINAAPCARSSVHSSRREQRRQQQRLLTPAAAAMAPEAFQAAPAPDELRPVQVSVNSSAAGITRALLYRLQHAGFAEVWASSAANHFTAITALAQAQAQLLEQPLLLEGDGDEGPAGAAAGAGASHDQPPPQQQQQQQRQQQQQPWERWCAGLAAVATLADHDQPTKDSQKRRLLKLTLRVQPAPELDAALLAPGQPGSISSNRVKGVPEVLALMQARLLTQSQQAQQGQAQQPSRPRPGAVCVVEVRGEQAVTRAVKAAMSLQAAAGQRLLLRPVAGKVVDVVAEKRGQALLADGLLLLWSWE